MYGTTSTVYYRKDFFEQYNYKPVDLLTWESLDKVGDKLTQKNNDEILVFGWELQYGARNLIDAAISNGGNKKCLHFNITYVI